MIGFVSLVYLLVGDVFTGWGPLQFPLPFMEVVDGIIFILP